MVHSIHVSLLHELSTRNIGKLTAHRMPFTHDYPCCSSRGVLTCGKVLTHSDYLTMVVNYEDGGAFGLLLFKILTDHWFIDHKRLNGHRVDRVSTAVTVIIMLVNDRDSYQAVAHRMPCKHIL